MNHTNKHEISIVIPAYNKSEVTDRCLDSILRHTGKPQELIIVDNGSRDDTPEKLLNWKTIFEKQGWTFTVLTIVDNIGYGRAINRGALAANLPYLALLNNDLWLLPNWDQLMLQALRKHQVSMVSPYIDESKPFDSQRLLQKGERFQKKNKNKSRHIFSAIMMFIKKDDFIKLGAFDERFFLTYEDTDLRERMDREGYKYLMVGDCFIWHQSMATRGFTEEASPYEIRGKELFVEKWKFDPSLREKTQGARWRRRWIRFCNRRGYL